MYNIYMNNSGKKNKYNQNEAKTFWTHKKPFESKSKYTTSDASIKNRFDFGEDEEVLVRNIKWYDKNNF